jgi:outer membrane protein
MKRIGVWLAASLAFAHVACARDLMGVYEDALQSDPQIRGARANRLASREARPQAWAALLPQLSATASRMQDTQDGTQATLTFDPASGAYIPIAEGFDQHSTAKTWSVDLRQSIFSWSNWMTLKQADSQVAQAEATYQAAEQNLILRVAQAYFNVLSDQDSLDANQASLEAISRQLDQANKRFEVGLIAITDVQEAKAAHDTAVAAVIAAKRTLATAGDQLSEITGQKYDRLSKPGDDMPLNSPAPASEDRWVQASLDQNVSLLSSRLAADIARENVKIAFGGHLPTLDLVASRSHTATDSDEAIGGLGPFSLDSHTDDRQYTLQISVPIFSGGLTQSRVRQSQYLWIAAKEQVTQTSRATEREARDAYLGVISGIARVQALRQALESSDTALKATEAGYEVGTRTAVDVLNSRRLLVQAQTDYSGSRYDYIISVIQLRLAAGNLSRSDVMEVNKWLAVTASTVPAQPLEAPSAPTQSETTPPPPQQ